MAREGFVVYHEMRSWLEPFGDAERGRLFTAMLEYSITGEAPGLSGAERFIWPAIREKIDRDRAAYEASCKKNRENIAKRYEKVQEATTVYDRIRPNEEGYQSVPNLPTETETKPKPKPNLEKEKSIKEKKFVAPTLDEVRAYVEERRSSVDPEKFFSYYEAGGWKDGKGQPVKNWKQKLITWETKEPAGRNIKTACKEYTTVHPEDIVKAVQLI